MPLQVAGDPEQPIKHEYVFTWEEPKNWDGDKPGEAAEAARH